MAPLFGVPQRISTGVRSSIALAGRILTLGAAVLGSGSVQAQTFSVIPQTIQAYAGQSGTASYSGDGGLSTSATINGPAQIAFDQAGNLYIADTRNNVVRKVTQAGYISTFAGTGTAGYGGDGGQANAAQLNGPEGVTVDLAGNVYISDTGNFIVRKVTPSGVISTYAGEPGNQGYTGEGKLATNERLDSPWGLAVDANSNLYISDRGNSIVHEVVASTGRIQLFAGSHPQSGFSGDGGRATSARLTNPEGLALDSSGNLYIADTGNNRVRIVSTSNIINTFAGNGSTTDSGDGGAANSAGVNTPAGVIANPAGDICIAQAYRLRCVSVSGAIQTIGGNGNPGSSGDGGPATSATVGALAGVAFDLQGRLYISDTTNSVVRRLALNTTFPATAVGQTSASQLVEVVLNASTTISSIGVPAGFNDFTIGPIGGCSTDGSTVNPVGTICYFQVTFQPQYPGTRTAPLSITAGGVSTTFGLQGAGIGSTLEFIPGIISTFTKTGTTGAHAAAVGPDGSVYIADLYNQTVRKVSASGGTSTIVAGISGRAGFSGDGGLATSATLSEPSGVALDAAGNLYIADFQNSRVRKVALNGIITTVAGNGQATNNCPATPTLATSVPVNFPTGLAVDSKGNVYIADGRVQCVFVLYPNGYMSTYAGNGANSYTGDGGSATVAGLDYPQSVATDSQDNLYIADSANNRIRLVTPAGIISTVAGNGTPGFSGDGGSATAAEINNSSGVAVDAAGNLYIADNGNQRLRVVDSSGIIHTIAGTGTFGYSGDGGLATLAQLGIANGIPTEVNTYGLAIGNSGAVYIPDTNNNVVRVINPQATAIAFPPTPDQTSSAAQSVDILNEGTANLIFSSFTATSGFTITSGTCSVSSPLAVGAVCLPSIVFTPTSGAGAQTGTASIADNALGTPQLISLTGTSSLQPTTTTVTVNPSPALYGSFLTLTAVVTPQLSGTSTGSVSFYDGAAFLGTGTLSGGSATLNVSLAQGTHTIKAVYGGDASYAGSTSAGTTEFVQYSTTTKLAVTASGSPVTTVAPGTVITLTASVKGNGTPLTVGTVDFCDASVSYCTDSHLLGTAQLNSSGTATLLLKPGIGSHSYKALFVSTANFNSTSSAPSSLLVTGLFPTTTSIAASGSAGNYTLTSTVVGVGSGIAPTGSVSFEDGSNSNYVLGTGSLIAGTTSQTFANSGSPTPVPIPRGSVTQDLNGDGIPDLAIASQTSNSAYILLGNGDGTFRAAAGSPIALQSTVVGIVAGDFNHDGQIDLALTCYGTGNVAILLGNGDGTFRAPAYLAVTSEIEAIATADLNHDGNLDLVVASQNSNVIYVLFGNGSGSFPTSTTVNTVNQPYSIVLQDLNGDGNLDILVGGFTDSGIDVFLGNGVGGFTAATGSPVPAGNGSFYIVTGDFRGNGNLDAVVTDVGSATVNVLLGNGDGTFAAASSLAATATGYKYAAIGDFNLDGKLDFATCDLGGAVGMYYGNGDGTFQPVATVANFGNRCQFLTTGDFNSDGSPDLNALISGGDSSQILLNSVQSTANTSLASVSIVGTGTHNVFATYPGDLHYAASVSGNLGLTAQPVATSVTVTASPGLGTYGAPETFTAVVSPTTAQNHSATGESVTFLDGGTPIGTGVLSGGTATFVTSGLSAGGHFITASYGGDANFQAATSGRLKFSVAPASPTITFSIPNHHTLDGPFTVNATSNSGGALTYSYISGPASISGSTVTLTGAPGTVVLQVTQSPSGNYSAGSQSASFSVIAGSVWIANGNSSLSVLDLSGSPASGSGGFPGTGVGTIAAPLGLAFDSSGNIWIANSNGLSEFTRQGASVNTTAYTGGGVTNPEAVAIDGAGNVWVANRNGTVSVLNSSGSAISPSSGYPGPGSTPAGIAIDISGNVWIPSSTANSVTKVLGAATPVVPLAQGSATGTGVEP